MGLFDFLKRKQPPEPPKPDQSALVPNEIQLQFVSLLFSEEPQLNKQSILAELAKLFDRVEAPEGDPAMAFFFPEYMVGFNEGSLPVQATIIPIDKPVDISRFGPAIQQAWHWPDAREVVGQCRYEITLTDLMSRSLAHQVRLDFFQRFVIAVVRATRPAVVHFRSSDKVLAADDYLSSVATEQPAFLEGALNVRLFRINGPGDEVLMDTLGLSAYGLADFECRFSGYNPDEIAGVLTGLAYYVFETGDQVRSNTTVQGIGRNPVWKTNYAASKVEPARLIVEVIPD